MTSADSHNGLMEKPKVVETEDQRFLCIIGRGPFDTCGKTFEELTKIAKENDLLNAKESNLSLLVLCDVPNTDKNDLMWACGVRTALDSTLLPKGVEELVVKGRCHATAIHKGAYEKLPKAWGALCMDWIPKQQNLKICQGSRECPHFEIYLNTPETSKTEDLETKLYCPVEIAS